MSRIEDAAIQDEIASSLLSPAEQESERAAPEQPESEYAVSGGALVDEYIDGRTDDVFKFGDEEAARRRGEQPEQEQRQPQERVRSERAPLESEQQEQPHAPTPEEVQAGVEQLDNAVKEYGLNEPADARQFADEFTGAFGSDVFRAGVDIESLGGVMSKTALSALSIYEATGGDMSKMGGIPPQNAQAFAHDFLKGMGLDPRSMPNVDASLLARTTLGGMVNFLRTYDSYGGRVTDLSKLNDPRQAEFYLQNFMQALGVPGSVNRETAVKFADACAKQLLRVMGKVSEVSRQRQEAQANQRQPRARGQRIPASIRAGIKGTKPPTKFQTNSGPDDPFSPQAMATYHERTARL